MQDTQQPGSSRKENQDYKGHFDGGEGGSITLEDAILKTTKFREKFPGQIKANFYGKQIIEQILGQPGCVGIRIYNGVDPITDKLETVLVGVNPNQQDILNAIRSKDSNGKGGIVTSEAMTMQAAAQPASATIGGGPAPCPTCCDPISPLTGTPN